MLQGLSVIVAIVSLCCYGYVIYQMFDKAESVIAIVCLVGLCLFGLGGLVAFVYGWFKARDRVLGRSATLSFAVKPLW
jgi:hypothetical protein